MWIILILRLDISIYRDQTTEKCLLAGCETQTNGRHQANHERGRVPQPTQHKGTVPEDAADPLSVAAASQRLNMLCIFYTFII